MSRTRRDERGVALVTVLLVAFAASGIALAAAMWMLNAGLITRSGERNSTLHDVAVAALEEGRSQINGNPALYPAVNYTTLELNQPVTDATGAVIPNVTRSLYAGPDGVISGQYGVFGTIISDVRDGIFGNRAVRRMQINQESFAKFAYFTNIEGAIQFANNDQIRGPVHSNDRITVAASGATFFDSLSSSSNGMTGQGNATFPGPQPRFNAPVIPMPTVAAFPMLQGRANNGGMSFGGNNNGNNPGEASVRIEFVAIDLNGDVDSTDPGEGFIRIYQDNNRPWYVAGTITGNPGPNNDLRRSPNCGAAIPGGAGTNGRFRTAADTNPGGARNNQAANLLNNVAGRRCYLGGDPRLTALAWPNVGAADWALMVGTWPVNQRGWIPRPAGMGAPTVPAFVNRVDALYLWPISRDFNPLFEGVIYVNGRVIVSGVVNGRVTVASPNNIIVADDLRMAVDPGSPQAADCEMILGLFSGTNIVVSDNTLNSPQQVVPGAGAWITYDETTQEDIHASLLALNIFTADNFAGGPDNAQLCGATQSGRGCLNLSGGVIQNTRGAVGLTDGTGYIKRYSYNACSGTNPPPYFPTTGRFVRNRIYELDPKNFDVAAWFQANQNN